MGRISDGATAGVAVDGQLLGPDEDTLAASSLVIDD